MMEEGGAAERARESKRAKDSERLKDSERCGMGYMYVAIGKERT